MKPIPAINSHGDTDVIIASCAAPGLLGRLVYSPLKQLKMTAKVIGVKPAGSVFVGLVAKDEHARLPARSGKRIRKLATRLV